MDRIPFNLALYDTLLARGLTTGMGNSDTRVCVEHAVALACGYGPTDSPRCVAAADRDFAIWLNDAQWADPGERAAALRDLGILGLDTRGTDRLPWARRVVDGAVRKVLPELMRSYAEVAVDPGLFPVLQTSAKAVEEAEPEGLLKALEDIAMVLASGAWWNLHYAVTSLKNAVADIRAADRASKDQDPSTRDPLDTYICETHAVSATCYAARAWHAKDHPWGAGPLKGMVAVAVEAYAAEGRTVESVLAQCEVAS